MKEIYMRSLCHTKIESLEYYFGLPPSRVYVCDLNHYAPQLIKEAQYQGLPVYGSSGRKPTNTKTLCHPKRNAAARPPIKAANITHMMFYTPCRLSHHS